MIFADYTKIIVVFHMSVAERPASELCFYVEIPSLTQIERQGAVPAALMCVFCCGSICGGYGSRSGTV